MENRLIIALCMEFLEYLYGYVAIRTEFVLYFESFTL